MPRLRLELARPPLAKGPSPSPPQASGLRAVSATASRLCLGVCSVVQNRTVLPPTPALPGVKPVSATAPRLCSGVCLVKDHVLRGATGLPTLTLSHFPPHLPPHHPSPCLVPPYSYLPLTPGLSLTPVGGSQLERYSVMRRYRDLRLEVGAIGRVEPSCGEGGESQGGPWRGGGGERGRLLALPVALLGTAQGWALCVFPAAQGVAKRGSCNH